MGSPIKQLCQVGNKKLSPVITGRCIRQDKRGFIDDALPCILTRLNITPDNWLKLTTQFEHFFKGAVGSPDAMSEFCQNQKLKRRQNVCHSKELLNTG